MIGEALKRGVIGEDDLFSYQMIYFVDAIAFFNDQNLAAMKAVDTWTLIGRNYRVVKDIRVLIGKMVWADRASAKYFLEKYTVPLSTFTFAFGNMEAALDSIEGWNSFKDPEVLQLMCTESGSNLSKFGRWGAMDENSPHQVVDVSAQSEFDANGWGSWGADDGILPRLVLEWPNVVDWSEDVQIRSTAWQSFDVSFDFDFDFRLEEERADQEATFIHLETPVDNLNETEHQCFKNVL